MKRIVIAALGAFSMVAPATGVAADTVFGIPLEERLSIPECTKDRYGWYDAAPKSICFKRDQKDSTATVSGYISIKFPFSQKPRLASSDEISATLIDGKIEGLSIGTHGISDQHEVLAALKAKYGEPSVFVPDTAQNRFGAKFEIFTAAWSTPTLKVNFESTYGRIDSGIVQIDTKKGSEWRQQQLKQLTQGGPSL